MIINADVLDWCRDFTGEPFHAALCDCPYELREVEDAELTAILTGTAGGKNTGGFMSQDWDRTGLVFRPETWRVIARCLHPGAFLFVFAGCLNDDLISVAMRRAGLRKHHKSLAWINGASMKKGVRADVQLDNAAFAAWLAEHPTERAALATLRKDARGSTAGKAALMERTAAYKEAAGVAREVTGRSDAYRENAINQHVITRGKFSGQVFNTAPATDLAAVFEGHSYGLQTLRPMAESILIFQKPYEGRAVDSIAATGAGTLNIDAARIPGNMDGNWSGRQFRSIGYHGTTPTGFQTQQHPGGRWPSSVMLCHNFDCGPAGCTEGCGVRAIGEQSGESVSKASQRGAVEIFSEATKGKQGWQGESTERGHNDSGNASRFYFNADYALERLEATDPMLYCPKASSVERDYGLEDFPAITVDDGRETPIDNALQRGETLRRNPHPCLKPLSLLVYLAKLLLPPAEYAPRRCLVPFAGVASEYIAARLAGFEEAEGIEITPEYIPYANARVAAWEQAATRLMTTDPAAILALRAQAVQASLFEETPHDH